MNKYYLTMVFGFWTILNCCSSQDAKIGNSIVLTEIFELKDSEDYPRERMFFLHNERKEKPNIDTMLVATLRTYVKSVNNQLEDEIYVPKDGEEKKLSILEGIQEGGDWTFKIIYQEHDFNDLSGFSKTLESKFDTSLIIDDEEIDLIYLPVTYYDISQIKKL